MKAEHKTSNKIKAEYWIIKEVFVNGIICTTMARRKKKRRKIICTTMASLLTSLLSMGLAINHLLKPKLMEFTLHFFSLLSFKQPFLFCPFFGIWFCSCACDFLFTSELSTSLLMKFPVLPNVQLGLANFGSPHYFKLGFSNLKTWFCQKSTNQTIKKLKLGYPIPGVCEISFC